MTPGLGISNSAPHGSWTPGVSSDDCRVALLEAWQAPLTGSASFAVHIHLLIYIYTLVLPSAFPSVFSSAFSAVFPSSHLDHQPRSLPPTFASMDSTPGTILWLPHSETVQATYNARNGFENDPVIAISRLSSSSRDVQNAVFNHPVVLLDYPGATSHRVRFLIVSTPSSFILCKQLTSVIPLSSRHSLEELLENDFIPPPCIIDMFRSLPPRTILCASPIAVTRLSHCKTAFRFPSLATSTSTRSIAWTCAIYASLNAAVR